MIKYIVDYNKYEDFIRVGWLPDGSDLQNFPTPSAFGRTLHDLDLDAYTNLQGYTERNRVRNNVEDIALGFNIASDNDLSYILERINKVWIYVELTDKRTKQKKLCKMYASDKTFDCWKAWKDGSNNWHTEHIDFAFSLVEQ